MCQTSTVCDWGSIPNYSLVECDLVGPLKEPFAGYTIDEPEDGRRSSGGQSDASVIQSLRTLKFSYRLQRRTTGFPRNAILFKEYGTGCTSVDIMKFYLFISRKPLYLWLHYSSLVTLIWQERLIEKNLKCTRKMSFLGKPSHITEKETTVCKEREKNKKIRNFFRRITFELLKKKRHNL